MSIPALRQPKFMEAPTQKVKRPPLEQQYIIITLRGENKLVLSSDAYSGILTVEEKYSCVFCSSEMPLDSKCKEIHKTSENHIKAMNALPFMEEFSDNLVRQLPSNNYYCAICNVVVMSTFLLRHIVSEVHIYELNKATARVSAYTAQCSST